MRMESNGDLKIEIRDVMWTFNPKNVSRLEGDGVPLTPGTSGESLLGHTVHENEQVEISL